MAFKIDMNDNINAQYSLYNKCRFIYTSSVIIQVQIEQFPQLQNEKIFNFNFRTHHV